MTSTWPRGTLGSAASLLASAEGTQYEDKQNKHNTISVGICSTFLTRLTRRVPLVEQELLTLPEHVIAPPFLVGFVLPVLQFYVYVV
jgi:hypothetical protein